MMASPFKDAGQDVNSPFPCYLVDTLSRIRGDGLPGDTTAYV